MATKGRTTSRRVAKPRKRTTSRMRKSA
jgi:hypothetical protein